MLKFLFALFVLLPLAELYVLIEVGSGIGGLTTVALCLLTAAIGGLLIRWQGLQTLLRARKNLERGIPPAMESMHGLLLALAGLLLFTPGFITDTIGFLLLIPGLRNKILTRFFGQVRQQGQIIDVEVIHDDRNLP